MTQELDAELEVGHRDALVCGVHEARCELSRHLLLREEPVHDGVERRPQLAEMVRGLADGLSERDAADSRIAGTKATTGGEIRNLVRDGGLAREELAAADRYRMEDPDIFARRDIIRSGRRRAGIAGAE